MSDISVRVKNIIAEHLSIDLEKVTENAKFIDDFRVDSLDLSEMVMKFESEFGIEIPPESTEKLVTVKSAIDYITEAQQAA